MGLLLQPVETSVNLGDAAEGFTKTILDPLLEPIESSVERIEAPIDGDEMTQGRYE